MKIRSYLTVGASLVAVAAMSSLSTGASAHLIYYPHRAGATMAPGVMPAVSHKAPYVAPKKFKSGKWTDVAGVPFSGQGGWGPLQLTDGTIMMKQAFTGTAGVWYKLAPDKKGNYTDGTWTKLAAMPAGYSPDFFAEQVLPDGRVLIEGGEYNGGSGDWTNKGALYDPVANSWTSVSPPSGWASIGDAESVILPDGTFMLGGCCGFTTGVQALASISGNNVTWTTSNTWTCQSGDPCMDEEGFTALPDGDVFLVDVWDFTSTSDEYWIYNTSAGTWGEAGNTPDRLSDSNYYELGAAPLTPLYGKKGTIIQLTANTTTQNAPNDIYDVASGKWKTGPIMKVGNTTYIAADAPSATLPDGNVLAEAGPGYAAAPAAFFEWRISTKGKVTATEVNGTKTSGQSADFTGNLLPLPTGQVLWDDSQYSTEVAVYTPKGKVNKKWRPVVSSVDTTLTVGSTGNAISGTNFNGFDLGGAYGDDAQAATNFPLVRITNTASGDVCFGRSYDFSTMGVWTSGTTNAVFDLPSSCETGASTLQVIVNGIASTGTSVTLNS
ncbi:MAG: hypothetical protein ACREHV_14135 [Rhizomicrobium sp.]